MKTSINFKKRADKHKKGLMNNTLNALTQPWNIYNHNFDLINIFRLTKQMLQNKICHSKVVLKAHWYMRYLLSIYSQVSTQYPCFHILNTQGMWDTTRHEQQQKNETKLM